MASAQPRPRPGPPGGRSLALARTALVVCTSVLLALPGQPLQAEGANSKGAGPPGREEKVIDRESAHVTSAGRRSAAPTAPAPYVLQASQWTPRPAATAGPVMPLTIFPSPAADAASGAASSAASDAMAKVVAMATAADAAASAAAVADAQQQARAALLQPLAGQPFPTRELLDAAIDRALCARARARVAQDKTVVTQPQLAMAVAEAPCPIGAGPPAAATAAEPSRVQADAASRLNEAVLAAQDLLAPPQRDRLLAGARRPAPDPSPAVQWTGEGCDCLLDDLSGEIYAIYPRWQATGTPQPVDFSVVTRIGYLGLAFDLNGRFPEHHGWSPASADFVREARRHHSQVDLVVQRSEWAQLLGQAGPALDATIATAVTDALALIDAPLTDIASRVQRRLPLLGTDARMGDGITVYFSDYPTDPADPDSARFAQFLPKFLDRLVTKMRAGGRRYGLHLVVPDTLFGRPPFDLATLQQLVASAEQPPAGNDAGVAQSAGAPGVTVHFLVLLSDPVAVQKKQLRRRVEDDPRFAGAAGRRFLRRIVPVVWPAGQDETALRDDLAYFEDNFGGVGLWGLPAPAGAEAPAGAASGAAPSGQNNLALLLRTVMRRDDASDDAWPARWVCAQALPLHLLLLLLPGALALAAALYLGSCTVRRLGRPYLVTCLALVAVWVLGLVALALWDPAFSGVRQGQALFWSGVAGALCAAGVAWMAVTRRAAAQGPLP